MIKKYNLIILLVFILVLSSSANAEISSNDLRYVYNNMPGSLMIGSTICFDSEENNICAPIIGYNIDNEEEDIKKLDFEITTKESIDISGRACIVESIGEETWENAMSSLTDYCSNFVSSNKTIEVSITAPYKDRINLILIPDSGSGQSDVVAGRLSIEDYVPPEEEPEPEEPEPEELSKCHVENITFDNNKSNVDVPVEITLETSNCNNSVIRIMIKKETLTTEAIVSEKQALVTGSSVRTIWVPEEEGIYYIETLSENSLKSDNILIKEFDKEDFFEDKEFYNIIDEIHKISKINEDSALEMCNRLGTQLERDVCIEDLAVYSGNKGYCAKIKDDMRKESCYSAFAIEGDVSSCIHSNDKATCIMLSLFASSNNISLKTEDKYENAVLIPEEETNDQKLIIILIILVAVILIMYFGFFKKR